MKRVCNISEFLSIFHEDKEYLKEYYGINDFPMRNDEVADMYELQNCLDLNYSEAEGFFISYNVPHIGHEIDMLKINDEHILNIELKRELNKDDGLKKLHKQQKYNYFYLKTLNKKVIIITFVSESKEFYYYDQGNQKSIKVERNFVKEMVQAFSIKNHLLDIDHLFEPSKFLISPFNDTDRFLEDNYYLTDQQKTFKKEILTKDKEISIIEGKAGTGKSLLLYDIAKEKKQGSKILIINCAQLNTGHIALNDKNWNIITTKASEHYSNYSELNYIFIDEAHRFRPHQLKKVLQMVKTHNVKLIVSIDQEQYMDNIEKNYDNLTTLKNNAEYTHVNLKAKIRTNPEIAAFIKNLMNLRNKSPITYKNISTEYIPQKNDWYTYINKLSDNGWKYLSFTPSRNNIPYHRYCNTYYEFNSHKVIGQEFDKVVIILDKSFIYFDNNLSFFSNDFYYNPRQMLFQNLTRARKEIKIVVTDNLNLFKEINRILNGA
ncbi:DNA/RNA helicase domain-containing protein [Staphylococcus shinii]|uniref:DNA/RNA helicase domain-containing protein n=1 Tax=Staphylococcus shinii TaxID=2912228 RepID=UPI003F56FB16